MKNSILSEVKSRRVSSHTLERCVHGKSQNPIGVKGAPNSQSLEGSVRCLEKRKVPRAAWPKANCLVG